MRPVKVIPTLASSVPYGLEVEELKKIMNVM